jgi:hypothetical protein
MMAFMTSCGSLKSYQKAPAASMMPEVKLNVDLNEVEFLGETTITVNSRSYLGIFHRVDKVNGTIFDRRRNTSVNLYGELDMRIPGDLKFAAEKVLTEFPDADFYAPGVYKEEVNQMFLGRSTMQTMVVKAYKYHRYDK